MHKCNDQIPCKAPQTNSAIRRIKKKGLLKTKKLISRLPLGTRENFPNDQNFGRSPFTKILSLVKSVPPSADSGVPSHQSLSSQIICYVHFVTLTF